MTPIHKPRRSPPGLFCGGAHSQRGVSHLLNNRCPNTIDFSVFILLQWWIKMLLNRMHIFRKAGFTWLINICTYDTPLDLVQNAVRDSVSCVWWTSSRLCTQDLDCLMWTRDQVSAACHTRGLKGGVLKGRLFPCSSLIHLRASSYHFFTSYGLL